jgi:hypothetical protein
MLAPLTCRLLAGAPDAGRPRTSESPVRCVFGSLRLLFAAPVMLAPLTCRLLAGGAYR